MSDTEWLQSLKPGDEVATGDRYYGYSVSKVTKVTPTQIVCGDYRYDRKTGRLKGENTWSVRNNYLQPITDEVRRCLTIQFIRNCVDRCNWHLATDEELLQVHELIESLRKRAEQSQEGK